MPEWMYPPFSDQVLFPEMHGNHCDEWSDKPIPMSQSNFVDEECGWEKLTVQYNEQPKHILTPDSIQQFAPVI